ncbi:MAG: hypothetical protein KF774_05215 [Planctomyces sp.]|nr:hypothetical protein [Planctomyces sp.]
MAARKKQTSSAGGGAWKPEAVALAKEILGHLNFSSGKEDPAFVKAINRTAEFLPEFNAAALRDWLKAQLEKLSADQSAFADAAQAGNVIELTLDVLLPAYREYHADLLFHLAASEFEQPFLLGRMFEAVLSQGGPWDERERIIAGAIQQLNDYVGYRPVAVLENGRKMELYPHERFRPAPLYIAGAGVAAGKYHDLIQRTLDFLKEAPHDLLRDAYLDLDSLEELALDVRAHDHLHPVNKRTNYMFGEWDPHRIDVKGHYRRFVVRQILLDALSAWVDGGEIKGRREERLFDAAAALCGTMLMASSVSGAGPDTFDSSVTLSSLLPVVARRRDEFYNRLMQQLEGARAKRLRREAEKTQQPFGHVRQYLNMHLAGYGARQVQYRELAYLCAQMGYADASREMAAEIPAASIRFETEIECQVSAGHHQLDRGNVEAAAEHISAIPGLLTRGIDCGALVDPWNILGFSGQFPLFTSREDAIPDNRVESLLDLVEAAFGIYGRCMAEAAAQGKGALRERMQAEFRSLAEWWDKFGSTVIEDLPEVVGAQSFQSAEHVAQALTEWRAAGEAAGDISFWRQHVDQFQSAQSYAQVIDALLERADHVASMGLLMQWLSRIDEVGFETPEHSVFSLLIRWMKLTTTHDDQTLEGLQRASAIRRLFDYLEANAEAYWAVPTLKNAVTRARDADEAERTEPGRRREDDEETDDVFGAAYEGVTYRDSTDDGNWGDTLENDYGFRNTEFELINREIEPRLKFLNAVAQLWQMAAVVLAREAAAQTLDADAVQSASGWHQQSRRWQGDLAELMHSVWEYEIGQTSGDHDSNVEYDIQLQVKFYLLHHIVGTLISLRNAERLLAGCLPESLAAPRPSQDEERVAACYRAIVRRDTAEVQRMLPQLVGWLEQHPLLYVPLENGGKPGPLLRIQALQSVVRFLLRELPKLGLLRETFHVLQTAFRMERKYRPEGQAITEFDRLFDLALRTSLTAVIQSSAAWDDVRNDAEALIECLGEVLDAYQKLWIDHSRTMRISSVDGLRSNEDWEELAEFIEAYGADLFHASQLTLGNVRAILHNGVDWYLDYLEKEQDPLHPMRLLEDMEEGRVDRESAAWALETIYSIVVDKFDRFLEYNTTTTQSDYGENFYCLLEFLRVEAAYDRDAWHMLPLTLVHEVLCRAGLREAARLWETTYEVQTADIAAQHLEDLRELQQEYGMRMPVIADHLNQRFVKPLAVNRMQALVKPAVADARAGVSQSKAFEELSHEIRLYLLDSWGSGIDVPGWIRALDKEVQDATDPEEGGRPGPEAEIHLPPVPLSQAEFREQIRRWRESLRSGKGRTSGDSSRRSPRGRRGRRPPKD